MTEPLPDNEFADAIHRRLEHQRIHTNYYGLFSSDGRLVAGDVLAYPSYLATDRPGKTLKHTLKVAADEQAPVARAMAEQRKDGLMLVIARDLTHILRIRETGWLYKALQERAQAAARGRLRDGVPWPWPHA